MIRVKHYCYDPCRWAKDPTLTDLENILANQEALDKEMSKVLLNDDKTILFSNKRGFES